MTDLSNLPESDERLKKPAFFDLAQKLGVDLDAIRDAPRSEGPAYMPHSEFIRREAPDGGHIYGVYESCTGILRIVERRERMVDVVCDVCGYCVTVRASVQASREWLLERAQLPERFASKQFEATSVSERPRHVLREWLEELPDPLHGPALHGPLGTGKTHLLTMVCKQLVLAHGKRVLFLSAPAWLSDLQTAFEHPAERERLFNRAARAEVLALDDLGAEQATDWRLDTIHELVDRRDRDGLALMLTTNVRPDDWGEAFDPRTASRLRGMTFALELKGPDRRQLEVLPAMQGEV